MAIYKGFSTAQWLKTKSFTLTDIDLVNQDLLNHIYTEVGSRLFMPSFGTRIPIMTFEPNDATTISILEEDLTTVFNYDPRVKLISLNVVSLPANNAIIGIANLLYLELNITAPLHLEFPVS
jgi:phage baseplate assembly protein W